MCTIFIAYKVNPDYPLVVIGNRDEFFDRATAPAEFWSDCPDLLAGKDEAEGGTWMGITKTSRIAMLTNFRAPEDLRKDVKSRGEIVSDFLKADLSPEEFVETLKDNRNAYNGYNLIFGCISNLNYYSNKDNKYKVLQPGIYGLSNHFLDTPWWKIEKGKKLFSLLVAPQNNSGIGLSINEFFKLLSDETRAPESQLPNTGIPAAYELGLSSIYVSMAEYGTRSSTVLTVDKDHMASFFEKTFSKEKSELCKKEFFFATS